MGKTTSTTPKMNARSFKMTETPSKRSTTSVRSVESKKTPATDGEMLPKRRSSLSRTMRGYSLDDPCAPSPDVTPSIGPQEKVYPNTSLHRSQTEGNEAETTEERTSTSTSTTSTSSTSTSSSSKSSAVKRSVELKSHDMKVKRSDSLTKDEKTVCNTKAREKERGHKRFSQRGESALKRRHTVGGTRDFDKVRIRWLTNNNHNHKDDCCEEENVAASPRWSAWDRLQPLISDEDLNVDRTLKTWMRSERMRTSSPELCRRSETCATFPILFTVPTQPLATPSKH